MLFGSPGALTMYSTAARTGLPSPNDTPSTIGPATYYVRSVRCRPCVSENVAPFLNTEIRKVLIPNGYPSPLDYYPYQRPRYEIGVPIIGKSDRFKNTRFLTIGPGPCYKVRDPWVALVQECIAMHSKRPRQRTDKYVSNNVPTVFHPLEMRAFITGIDGRMYPLRNKDFKPHIPGPIYNTRGIYTSRSNIPRKVDFSHAGERPSVFNIKRGAGPADYSIPRCLNMNGGVFLGKTNDPQWSQYRYFDFIVCKTSKTIYPSPFNHYIQSCFDKPSPKAVMAPFKSTAKRLADANKFIGPGPADYFQVICSVDDLDPPVYPRYPSYFTMPPEFPPFNCTAERFVDSKLFEEEFERPSPASYHVPSFTDKLWCRCKFTKPALCNPNLGFLTSAKARPDDIFKSFDEDGGDYDDAPPRAWRSVRPRRIRTYPYHGPPPRYPDSPGPIYDTNPAIKAIKSRREWWDPRQIVDVGFDTSGCTRKINITPIDKNIPGPGLYYSKKPEKRCLAGTIKTTGPRTGKFKSMGPGPRHKIHEKYGSGTWRASHLGTFNIYLKGVDVQRPCAGGFRPHGPLDKLADISSRIDRTDPYASQLCPVVIKRLA